MMKKILFTLIALCAVFALLFMGYQFGKWLKKPDTPITLPLPRTDPSTDYTPQDVIIMNQDNVHHRQDDPLWDDVKLGKTNQTIGSHGCTVSSVAMAVQNLTGDELTPAELNENLNAANGFTKNGWLIWGAVPKATGNRAEVQVFSKPETAHIHKCIADGNYPIVKIFLNGHWQHWVTIVGRTENDYLIRDPLKGDLDLKPILLSTRGKEIHAVRCVRLIE